MDLSVIIVNYNVRFFLEQCLHSVKKASEGIKAEIIVIDNNSTDGSVSMLRQKFPEVKLIENPTNTGFSVANNQGLAIAKGRYCLLLNPDTLVEEETFRKCARFMDDHPEAGALGVKMIDGKGNFTPESKRSLPTPVIAFYKIFGLSGLFPKSRIFGRYHLGFLDNNKIHIVNVLSGAFMFIRRETLDKTGLLDEDFFMYGEDIDISYRITKAGYKNYYFPETTIIHYKGESTKKGSINYVILFYKAMIIFANKHFTKNNARLSAILINFAIYFRASLSIIKRFLQGTYQPFIDALLLYAGFLLISRVLEIYRFETHNYFPELYFTHIVPSYILIWITSIYYSGGYERPIRIWNLLKGTISGAVFILLIYSMLPEALRFSRLAILLGTVWGAVALLLYRVVLQLLRFRDYEFSISRKSKIIIVGGKDEFERVHKLMKEITPEIDIIGFVSDKHYDNSFFIGNTNQLREAVLTNKIDEIIFCAADIPSKEIIRYISRLSDLPLEFKTASPESPAIIGSNSVRTSDDLYLLSFNSIGTGINRRNKRLFDVLVSLLIIIGFPVFAIIFPYYHKKLHQSLSVLAGKKTWVGYDHEPDLSQYPVIRNHVYSLSDGKNAKPSTLHTKLINSDYARDYRTHKDVAVLWRNLIRGK